MNIHIVYRNSYNALQPYDNGSMSKNKLIVDFPRRWPSKGIETKEEAKPSSVHFSQMSTVVFFQDDIDPNKIWYSADAYTKMREDLKQASIDVQKKLSLSQRNSYGNFESTPSETKCLTGMEHLLSVKLIKKAYACRMKCLNAVLEEQKRQRYRGEYDPDALTLVSQHHSKWSRKRAFIIGMFNAET